MNKPSTPLHDKSYIDDWKHWLKFWMESQDYPCEESAVRGTMKETGGRINPQWVKEAWENFK